MEVTPGEVLLAKEDGSTYKKGQAFIFKGVIHQRYRDRVYLKFQGRRGCFLPDNVIPLCEASRELRDLSQGISLEGSMSSALL